MEPAAKSPTRSPAKISAKSPTWKLVLAIVLFLTGGAVLVWSVTRHGAGAQEVVREAAFAASSPTSSFDMSDLQVPEDQLLAGGPPKDGIPALTDPGTTSVADAEFMRPDDRVIVVTIDGQTRGYPLRVLNWHEIVNDTLGDTPIAVVYCPLCDSASVVDRRLGDKTFEFGVSGLLHKSNVVFYDRQDDALWSQLGMEAISGPHAGKSLDHLPFAMSDFSTFAKRHPQATIVTLDTGHDRNYDGNPYESYFAHDRTMFPTHADSDGRLSTKTRVIGVRLGDETKAFTLSAVARADEGKLETTIGGKPLILRAADDGHVEIVESPEDAQITHTFWFAWAAFHPDTELVAAEGEASTPQ